MPRHYKPRGRYDWRTFLGWAERHKRASRHRVTVAAVTDALSIRPTQTPVLIERGILPDPTVTSDHKICWNSAGTHSMARRFFLVEDLIDCALANMDTPEINYSPEENT